MTTLAEAEWVGDPQLVRRIRQAEEASGFRSGVRFSATGRHIVEVSFYPTEAWWITDLDAQNNRASEKRRLTEAEFKSTWGLKL